MKIFIQKYDESNFDGRSNSYLLELNYNSDLSSKEIGILEYDIHIIGDKFDKKVCSEYKTIIGGKDVFVSEVFDAAGAKSGDEVVFKYRIFTIDSSEGPQLEKFFFESEIPINKPLHLPFGSCCEAVLSMLPGGYAKCEISIAAAGYGDWGVVGSVFDKTGRVDYSSGIAVNGVAMTSMGLAGKPKEIGTEVQVVGANQWVTMTAVLP